MIVNGIDIIGYEWAKFVKSDKVNHEIKGKDIILYGNKSTDFSYLFDIVSSVDILDSEYIDVSPGVISRIGSISVQSNSVEPVLLDVILTDTEETQAIVSNNSVIIICNTKDQKTIDLGALSDEIKILRLAKEHTALVGNIRNARIFKDMKINEPYYNSVVYSLNNCFYTNINYTRCLNRLNYEISQLMPDFTFVLGKRDSTNDKPNTIYCNYSNLEQTHHKFFRRLRRNMMHKLKIEYEFRITDDIKYAKYFYEMSNYDFVTNICELTVNDDNDDIPWYFAVHWMVDDYQVDLQDPKTGNDTVSRSIKCDVELHTFVSIDNYVACLKNIRDSIITDITCIYKPCNEIAIFTKDYTIMD